MDPTSEQSMNVLGWSSGLGRLGTECPQVPTGPNAAFPLRGHRPVDSASRLQPPTVHGAASKALAVCPWGRAGQMVAWIWANVKIDSPSGPAKLVGNPKGVDNSTRENEKVVGIPASCPRPRASPLWCLQQQGESRPAASYQVALPGAVTSLALASSCVIATSWGVPYLTSLHYLEEFWKMMFRHC